MITSAFCVFFHPPHSVGEWVCQRIPGSSRFIEPPQMSEEAMLMRSKASVLSGQQSAIDGLDLSAPCVPGADEASESGHMMDEGRRRSLVRRSLRDGAIHVRENLVFCGRARDR